MKTRLLTGSLLALMAFGCEAPPAGEAGPGKDTVEAAPTGPGLPIDHPPVEEPPTSSKMRRLSLAQLRNAISTVLGKDVNGKPITWMVTTTTSGFTRYAATLGEADYVNITEDDLEPSALYLKFVGDAARDVCTRALDADAKRTSAADRVLLRHVEPGDTVALEPAAVDQNLRYLKLRFHGIKLHPSDEAGIAPLRKLFEAAGWHAVCVALLTDPEFHLY